MNAMTKTLLLSLILIFSISCSSDYEGNLVDDISGCEQLLTELNQDLADAATAFSQNPNKANCNAYRNTALDFLDELEDCAVAVAQFEAIQETAQEVADLDCTQFE